MPDRDRDGAEDSGSEITRPGAGTRDEGQGLDGGRQSRRMRDFRDLKGGEPVEAQDVG
jgi:hypothetical protein